MWQTEILLVTNNF